MQKALVWPYCHTFIQSKYQVIAFRIPTFVAPMLMLFSSQKPVIYHYHGNWDVFCNTKVTGKFVYQYEAPFEGYQ